MLRLDEVLAFAGDDDRAAFVTTRGSTSWREWGAAAVRWREHLRRGVRARPEVSRYTRLVRDACGIGPGAGRHRPARSARDDEWIRGDRSGAAPGWRRGSERARRSSRDVPRRRPQSGWTRRDHPLHLGKYRPAKPVTHRWESLTRPVRRNAEGVEERWLLTYRPNLYAGLQVLMHCLLNRATLVLPSPRRLGPRRGAALVRGRGHPCLGNPFRTVPGSSPWPDRRRSWSRTSARSRSAGRSPTKGCSTRFRGSSPPPGSSTSTPPARWAAASRSRMVAKGFPLIARGRKSRRGRTQDRRGRTLCSLGQRDVNRGERFGAAEALPARWATGDLVERVDDRVRFVGRRTEVINVGGNKVHPLAVEQVVRAVPCVADVRVYARKSSLAGFLIACEIVVEPGTEPESVRRDVQRHCAEQLASHQRPRFLEVVPAIHLSGAGKKIDGREESFAVAVSQRRAASHRRSPRSRARGGPSAD